MTYIAVKDLKQGGALWDKLEIERELVITRDGRPCAILVGIDEHNTEESLAAIRKALFTTAVGQVRRRTRTRRPPNNLADKAIRASRKDRRVL